MFKYTNKLINETSPYLLQHAHNPVNWYPWSEEAFKQAKDQDKPVFLSIGYSSCHWCHVMEEESFENEKIAAIMNEYFINIKVDREERPDVDQVYMEYVQMTTGSGGWPMSVFLTPGQIPFFGGTYFPPQDKYGRPGFERILLSMYDYYNNQKEKLLKNVSELQNIYAQIDAREEKSSALPSRAEWAMAVNQLASYYEPVYGGIGSAPKFPAVNIFYLFLRYHAYSGESHYLEMVQHTLQKMAGGGIYDQIGGGFARYSVDEKWLVPHFEKMLYDNAQLIQLYLDTYVITEKKYFLEIAEETLSFVEREMFSREGAFYSSLDADSEGQEGKFYLWDKAEIDKCLAEDSELFCKIYNVTETGNFEGENILNIAISYEEAAKIFNLETNEVKQKIKKAKAILLKEREKRIRPDLDDKIIASWNGLMLSAFAKAYQITGKEGYKKIIRKNCNFIRDKMIKAGKILRTYKSGVAKYDGFIEDYAMVAQGYQDSYEALFDPQYLKIAMDLILYANDHFWDDKLGGYFTTSDSQAELVRKMKDVTDSSIPSATGIMLLNNLRLFFFSENNTFYHRAEALLKKYGAAFGENPYGYATYLAGLDFYLEKPREIVIAKYENQNIDAFLKVVFKNYLPNKIIKVLSDNPAISLLKASAVKDKSPVENKITVYICHDFQCSLPIFTVRQLENALDFKDQRKWF